MQAERRCYWGVIVLAVLALSVVRVFAAEGAQAEEIFSALGWIVVVLVAARLSTLITRLRQPEVLGEILAGIALSGLSVVGITWLEPMRYSRVMQFLAEVGAVILLFQIGLESNVDELRRVGWRAALVGTVGVVLPFVGGYIVGQLVFPEFGTKAAVFLGATLTATSVGISVRVMRELGAAVSTEAAIILGAAVIDDVLGIVMLAVVQGLVVAGSFEWGAAIGIVLKALVFLVGAIVVGARLAPVAASLFARISSSESMKLVVPIAVCFLLAWLAHAVGLAPIIGGFAAGLILDQVHFLQYRAPEVVEEIERDVLPQSPEPLRTRLSEILHTQRLRHVEELIEPLAYFFVPIFFVMAGFNVDLRTLGSVHVIVAGLLITAVAIVGKLAVGLVAGPVRRWVVGWGMVPRGEVGLIFASVGLSLGVVLPEEYSAIMLMVMLTTVVTPIVLTWLLRRAR